MYRHLNIKQEDKWMFASEMINVKHTDKSVSSARNLKVYV